MSYKKEELVHVGLKIFYTIYETSAMYFADKLNTQ